MIPQPDGPALRFKPRLNDVAYLHRAVKFDQAMVPPKPQPSIRQADSSLSSSGGTPWRGNLVLAGVVGMIWWLCFRFPAFWMASGIGEATRPFLDLYALLAACDAVKLGLNPLLPNMLDPYNRPFCFSEWWFELARLGWGRKDTLWLGTALLAATLVTAVQIARPVTRREQWALGLLLVSPAWLLAVNRANQDLVIFLVSSLGLVCFRNSGGPARALGVILFASSAVLKFFPLATLVLLLDFRSRRQVLAGFVLYALVLLLAWPGLAPALRLVGRQAPTPEWLYAFGAPVLMRDFGFVGWLGWLLPAGFLIGWAIREAGKHAGAPRAVQADGGDAAEREFVCGAVLIVGAFFLGASYLYKLVFAAWLLPWLWRQYDGNALEARWARVTWSLLLAVVWLEGTMALVINLLVGPWWSQTVAVGLLKATLVISQLLTWALVACLLRFLLIYVARRGRTLLLPG